MHFEYRNTDIYVSVVFPGGVNSTTMENSGVAMSKTLEALQKVIKNNGAAGSGSKNNL
jgi:hypothetical protein